MTTIILASASTARRTLLENAGVPVAVLPAPIDERALETPLLARGASPADLATALADAKAAAVGLQEPEALVIGADQTLDLDGERFTKPASGNEARDQLARLSGRSHHLHSAVAVALGGDIIWRHRESATLTMRHLNAATIDAYLADAGEAALSSVGGYQIEGPGIRLFQAIAGDFFTILGLPLLPLLACLREESGLAW